MHPYKNLPDDAFWTAAVSQRHHLDFADVYRKKFEIRADDRIVAAGSCFAQHIARRMRVAGFNYRDYEPPPPRFPENLNRKFGYGIYSARYNNIYTARQLLQTFQRAFGSFKPHERVWQQRGRFFDAFRPTVEPDGFVTLDELESSQASHFAAVRRVFTESDVFIFTLGLTEAWESSEDGAVFPVCPGTAAGTFDAGRHSFRNLTFNETLGDLVELIDEARRVNSELRFLLTVSPVPLVATASGNHVLTATVHSKSVLRAVAGELAQRFEFVDYFPAYELVASHPVRAALFEPDLRNVASAGVDIVMRHFFSEHRINAERHETAVDGGNVDVDGDGDSVCEEVLLAGRGR